jgi:polysaccharide biosynthesis protein PslH
MKILMVGHFVPYPPSGGSLQRTYNILREIAKENSVHLLTLNQKALLPDDDSVQQSIKALRPFCKTIKVYESPAEKTKVRWSLLLLANLLSTKPYSVWKFKSSQIHNAIKRELENSHFDLVYFDTIDLAQYASLVKKIPMVLNHHNMESALLIRRSANEHSRLLGLYLRHQGRKLEKYEKKMVGKFDVNLVVSETDSQELGKFAPESRFEVVPNGTDIEYFTPAQVNGSSELVFAGGMNWYPNRDAMIYFCEEVLPLVKKACPDVVINIIGQDPPEQIKKMAAKDSAIKVHGFVKDVRDYINRSAVYVVPIRVGGGTRLKILDAFACGKALVSTSVGCEGIDVTPGKDILISDTSDGFADHVISLLKNRELRKILEVNARKLVVDKYSWTIIGKKVRQILKDAIK